MLLGHRTGKPAIIARHRPHRRRRRLRVHGYGGGGAACDRALLVWNMGFSVGESWIAASTAL
jgi:uncharacterized membrane protein